MLARGRGRRAGRLAAARRRAGERRRGGARARARGRRARGARQGDRAAHPSRRDRVHRGDRRAGRRGVALVPLRPDVLRRRRHGPRAPAAGGGRRADRRPRPRARRRARARHRAPRARPAWAARTACTPSRRRSGSSCSAGGTTSRAAASGSSAPSRASRSASSRAPSAPTATSTRASRSSRSRRSRLAREDVATQVVGRDRHAELLAALAILGSSLDRFATEIRHLQRSEVREAAEPFARGQKGSSAMPHKRNPITCERISGLARVLRGNARRRLRERAAVARARHLALLGGARRAERLDDPCPLPARPLRVGRRGARGLSRAHAAQHRRGARPDVLGQRPARARREPARRARRPTRSCSATPCGPSTRSCRCGSCSRPTPRPRRCSMPLRSIASSISTPPCATRAWHSTALEAANV